MGRERETDIRGGGVEVEMVMILGVDIVLRAGKEMKIEEARGGGEAGLKAIRTKRELGIGEGGAGHGAIRMKKEGVQGVLEREKGEKREAGARLPEGQKRVEAMVVKAAVRVKTTTKRMVGSTIPDSFLGTQRWLVSQFNWASFSIISLFLG